MTENDIARRAYELYLARDCEDGHDVADWLQAERELQRDLYDEGVVDKAAGTTQAAIGRTKRKVTKES